MRRASCSCFVASSRYPLRRWVGKQTPAAPELQLRDVVWSDESFFRLRVRSWRIFGHFFSLSLPRIWLSRSTSKIDALDDDETPLRLTASQTATTRGVMVSGIMGALDIALTLHFVEPGLKINSEEWIKVMDEYIVPNCAALMELGRKFL